MKFFDDMDSDNKVWFTGIVSVCGLFAVIAICLCVHCTVQEIHNPQPRSGTVPTIKARMVPVE